MGGSLIQPCRVNEEGALRRKVLLAGKKSEDLSLFDGTCRISTG
jgi:hypothetical protein